MKVARKDANRMICETLDALRAELAPKSRLLGLDMGARTIGLALSDVTRTVATPMDVIRRKKLANDLDILRRLVAEHDVGGLVVGLPIAMDGREGSRAQSVRRFARDLAPVLEVPIAFWDERLSTAAVERLLIEDVDMTRKRRRQVVDKMAAAYILQGALDAMSSR